jgi:hypothetical protein
MDEIGILFISSLKPRQERYKVNYNSKFFKPGCYCYLIWIESKTSIEPHSDVQTFNLESQNN